MRNRQKWRLLNSKQKRFKDKSTDAIPAEETLDIGYDVKVNGVSATVQKVDLTSDETRVYIKVKNGTKKNIEIYPDQSILSQDGNDYESDLENYLYDDVHMQKKYQGWIEHIWSDHIQEDRFKSSIHIYIRRCW